MQAYRASVKLITKDSSKGYVNELLDGSIRTIISSFVTVQKFDTKSEFSVSESSYKSR